MRERAVSAANDDYAPSTPESAIPAALGRNLRRLRTRQGLSLERLARLSGVSRAMLGQIELGRSAPTITVLWKIARALDVTLTALTRLDGRGDVLLMREDQARSFVSPDGLVQSRSLAPPGEGRGTDFLEIRLRPGGCETGGGVSSGASINLVVAEGAVELCVGKGSHRLAAGDAVLFEAERTYQCRNADDVDARLFLVLSHGES